MQRSAWRSNLDATAHEESKILTQNALNRLTSKDVERRVSSSSFSSRVFVTDCCWVPTSASASTFVLCGLSNDSVCLLNINNLSKMYLFEEKQSHGGASSSTEDKDRRESERRRRESGRRRFLVHRQVSLECSPALPAEGGRVVLGMVLDGWVQSCVLDTTSASQLKKLQQSGSAHRVLELPKIDDASTSLQDTLFRFSPAGSRAFALLSYETVCEDAAGLAAPGACHYRVALFKAPRGGPDASTGRIELERSWCVVVGGMQRSALSAVGSLRLRHFGWWDESSLLSVWSNGVVELHRVTADEGLQVSARSSLFPSAGPSREEEVRLASATAAMGAPPHPPLPRSGASLPLVPPPPQATTCQEVGLLAIVVGASCAITFNLSVLQGSEEVVPAHKRTRAEEATPSSDASRGHNSDGGGATLQICPTQHPYFSEDIPLRSLTFAFLHSWVVVAVLESGAVIFLDAQTMELLVHRPRRRLMSEDDEAVVELTAEGGESRSLPNPKRLRCFTSNRPLNIATVEHHTITLFKPQ